MNNKEKLKEKIIQLGKKYNFDYSGFGCEEDLEWKCRLDKQRLDLIVKCTKFLLNFYKGMGKYNLTCKTINKNSGSYRLKHQLEVIFNSYVSNGMAIVSLLLAGITIQKSGKNCEFIINQKGLQFMNILHSLSYGKFYFEEKVYYSPTKD